MYGSDKNEKTKSDMKQTPKILNILGLAVAIAAFMVVAMVRYYDLRYDKSHLLGVAHEKYVLRQRYDREFCPSRGR